MMEGPYKLPKGWRWVRIGEVCTINPRRPQIRRKLDEPTTFVPMMAVDEESGTIVSAETRPFNQVKKGYTYFEEEDVLFAKITPCMENGKSAIVRGLCGGIGFGSTEFHVLRPKELVIPEWIWLFIRQISFRERAKEAFRGGVGQQRVPQKFLEGYLIPLPSLSEQKRIVAKIQDLLSRVREVRRLRQEAQEEVERLWQSVLADTFPKPGTKLPEGWKWLRLDECITTIESGKRPKGGVRKLKIEKGIFSIGGEHLTWEGDFDFSKPRLIPEEYYYSIKKGKIKHNDILIVKDGATTGKTAFISENFPFLDACVNEHVFIIRGKEDLMLPKYLFLFLLSSVGKKQILSTFHGAAQGGINSQFVKKVFIPVTSLANQKNIVSYLESIKEKIIALKKSQEKVDCEIKMLERIILEKAFHGEL